MTDQTQQPAAPASAGDDFSAISARVRHDLETGEWGQRSDGYGGGFSSAHGVFTKFAGPNESFDDLMKDPALAYKILARIGAAGGGVQQSQQAPADVRKLLTHPAAGDPRHPEHRTVRAELDRYYAARNPGGILP